MVRKAAFIIVCFILIWHASGLFTESLAQSVERVQRTESLWVQIWKYLTEHPIIFTVIIVTVVTIFTTVMAMVRKDKLLKSISGHLITIELKNGERHRGRLRVESEGLEVVAEKANEGNEKVSYLLREDEFKNIHALVRYHDFLTDREKEERDAEVDRVYHPSIGMRLRRRIRNVVNQLKRIATEAFTLAFGTVRKQFKGAGVEDKYTGEIEKAGQEAITYATEAAYDTLIDRLIGTRVVAYVNKDLEYVGVLKDYTSNFIELLDVNYKNTWEIVMERGDGSKHERGLILRKDGDDIVIQSKSPFRVTLKHIYWREDRAEAKLEKINQTIEPFGELRFNLMPPKLDIQVNPFDKLQLPTQYHYQEYKKIFIHFESVRVADIVLLKDYGIVRHRTEKYEPKLLDLGALTDALLTEKGEELVLEGNPSATPLTIHNGYLTNLPSERMDFAEVDDQLNKRWAVDNFYATLDKRLRPISNHYFLRFLPLMRARKILALLALIVTIHADEKRKKDPLLPLSYIALCSINHRKRCRFYKDPVLIKKRKRLLGFLPRPSQV